jgi:predicted TIM-barrel fold metal-dependent hydrolase
MTTTTPGLDRIIDIDNHYYETDDAFTRHLPASYSGPTLHIRRGDDGVGQPWFGDSPSNYLQQTPTDKIAKAGLFATERDDRVSAQLSDDDMVVPRALNLYMDRDVRLKWMDEHRIETAVLWPSLGLTVEQQMRRDPAACVAGLRAFNRWLDEEWGFNYQGRIMASPLLTLFDLDEAVAELEAVVAMGARTVHLMMGPVHDRSLADPYFDPFWARLQEIGIPFAFHAGNPGLAALLSVHWGEDPEPTPERYSAFQRFAFWNERAIVDTVASLILHNLYGRFPRLQTLIVELASEWVPHTLVAMDGAARAARKGNWLGGPISDLPSEIFRRHFSIMPFIDEDIRGLVGLLGADRVLLGSDFPHPEGLDDPWWFVKECRLEDADAVKVCHDNAAALLGKAGR